MHGHRVVDRAFGEDIFGGDSPGLERQESLSRAPRHIEPDRLARRRQRRVRQRETEGLTYHLGCCRGSEKLTSAARRGAGVAGGLGRLLQGDLAVSKARSNRLNLTCVLANRGR